jgi:hypothetical protein
VQDVHKELASISHQCLEDIFQQEASLQFTLNEHYLLESQQAFDAQLRKAWVELHFGPPEALQLSNAVARLRAVGGAFKEIKEDDVFKCSMRNKDLAALMLMSTV